MRKLDNTMLVRLFISAAIVVFGGTEFSVWATTACQEPNPSTVFCTTSQSTANCGGSGEFICRLNFDAFDRNKFPDGPVSSANGTTTEDEADCSCRHLCVWDDDNRVCGSCMDCCEVDGDDWDPADKTVVGQAACPTQEG